MDGLRDFQSWEDICAISKPENRNLVPLYYRKHMLNRPVYPRSLAAGDDSVASSLVDALAKVGIRTGFRDRVTPGAIRRETLLKVDSE